ncbi:MAG TPA: TonB family protein [Thermoanaerobaculia bacterium]|jgi:protein TonB
MFEHSLIDLEAKQHQQPRRRWISLPIAVGLHVVGLTAFAFASYWNVGEVPEPNLNVVFLSMAPLPQIPAGGGDGQKQPEKQPERQEQTPQPQTRPLVQPTDETVPDEVTKHDSSTPVEEVIPGTGDEGPAVSDGPGGPGDCPDCPPGPGIGPGPGGPGVGPGSDEPGDSQPVQFTVGMTRPEPIHKVQPRYTEPARRAGIQGTVIVEAIIDEKGYVTNARVLRGLPMGLDREAVDAILQWRFTPARMNGRPVSVYFTLTATFTIQR